MRLLLVNPNTSASITAMLAGAARRHAAGRAEIVPVTAAFGHPGLQTPAHCADAVPAVVQAFAGHPGHDAGIVAAFADPGMTEARAVVPFPIVGLAEEGLRAAGAGGRRFAIVTMGPALRPLLEAKLAALGLGPQVARLHYLAAGVLDIAAARASFLDELVAVAARCVAMDGAEAVLFGGAPFAGVAAEIRHRIGVPVLDGVDAAVDAAIDAAGRAMPRRA